MKSEHIHLEPYQIDHFISSCYLGSGRIVIRHKADKVVLEHGRLILKKDGIYIPGYQPRYDIKELIKRMIDKYERFEYEGYLYHSPELNVWIKEEI